MHCSVACCLWSLPFIFLTSDERWDGHLPSLCVASKNQKLKQPRWTMLPLVADIFPTTRPMTAISSVLESSHQALSIRHIFSPIGRLLLKWTGQKGGQKAVGGLQIRPTAVISIQRSKFDQIAMWQPIKSSHQAESNSDIAMKIIYGASFSLRSNSLKTLCIEQR